MKNRPIHQNLDTSFVNLSALIKYLRRRQFVGKVKIQLNGYKADIELIANNQLKVSEHDQISGRVSTGEEALQRLLIRARESGGTINVYQLVESETPVETPKQHFEPKIRTPKIEKKTETILDAEIIHPIPKPTELDIPQNGNGHRNKHKLPQLDEKRNSINGTNGSPINIQDTNNSAKKSTSLPDFPFSLTNKAETKAKVKELSVQDWQILLKLTVEILVVVDKTLAGARLDFSAAFRKARSEVADDYPFLNPSAGIFDYKSGKIKMTKKVNEKIFIVSIFETLRRILAKLESNPKFKNVHLQTTQNLIALMHKRQPHYDKFSITVPLKQTLGL